MNQPVIIIEEDFTTEKAPEQSAPPAQKAKASGWNIVWIIIMGYVIIVILCYFFNKEWYKYLFETPKNKLLGMFHKSK